MQSFQAAAELLDAWQGGVHWCQKHSVNWGSWSSMASRWKTGKRRKADGKETFLADPKVKCNFFFTKTPSLWLSYCSKYRKICIFAVNMSEVTQFNAWMKQTLGSMLTQGKTISHEISLVICSFITLNPQTLMCKGKIPSDFWDGPTTSNLVLWPSKQRTCTVILEKRAKFFPMQSSIWHPSKTQLTSFPVPPDLKEGAGKDKMGKPKTCLSAADRVSYPLWWQRRGHYIPQKPSVPGPTIHQLVGYAVLLTTNTQPWAKGNYQYNQGYTSMRRAEW